MPEDQFLSVYVAECAAHLETVEADLLELERLGSAAPPEPGTRLFVAAHAIKRGAAFLELSTIKNLAHTLENVLEMVRSGHLAADAEVVRLLFQGFDKMKLLFADIASASDADVGDEILALTGLASSYLPPEKKELAAAVARYPVPGSTLVLEAGELLVDSYRSAGNRIVLLCFDLIHDVQRLGKLPRDLLAQIDAEGVVLDCGIDIFGVGNLDQESVADRVPFYVLLSTGQPTSALAEAFAIDAAQVQPLESPLPPTASMGPQEAEAVVRLTYDLTGISLEPSRENLEPLLRRLSTLGTSTTSELVYRARLDPEFRLAVIDRVTDPETSFFRDAATFDLLAHRLLPELAAARGSAQTRPRIRVWSAACSKGQEAYSIAMVLDEVLGSSFEFEIVGTDISRSAVAQAATGQYTAEEIGRGLAPQARDRYFIREGGMFIAGPRLRSLVTFRRLNLHEDFAAQGRWDVILCAHVAQLFSETARASLFERLHDVIEPDGVLILGPDEPTGQVCPPFALAGPFPGVFFPQVR